jgi:hypothetical protein
MQLHPSKKEEVGFIPAFEFEKTNERGKEMKSRIAIMAMTIIAFISVSATVQAQVDRTEEFMQLGNKLVGILESTIQRIDNSLRDSEKIVDEGSLENKLINLLKEESDKIKPRILANRSLLNQIPKVNTPEMMLLFAMTNLKIKHDMDLIKNVLVAILKTKLESKKEKDELLKK